jgi:hypothetical protein
MLKVFGIIFYAMLVTVAAGWYGHAVGWDAAYADATRKLKVEHFAAGTVTGFCISERAPFENLSEIRDCIVDESFSADNAELALKYLTMIGEIKQDGEKKNEKDPDLF